MTVAVMLHLTTMMDELLCRDELPTTTMGGQLYRDGLPNTMMDGQLYRVELPTMMMDRLSYHDNLLITNLRQSLAVTPIMMSQFKMTPLALRQLDLDLMHISI